MSTAMSVSGRSSFVNAEMAKAHAEAIRSVDAERSQPPHIRAARARALLRWLDNTD